jgi:hypothetical protein
MRTCVQALLVLMGLTPIGVAQAQAGAADLAPGQWRLDAEQVRLSALIDGRLVEDEKSFVHAATDRVDSWARSQVRLSWLPVESPWALQWAAFVDAQLHVKGSGGQAIARVNNKTRGEPGARYPLDLESLRYRRLGISVARALEGQHQDLLQARWAVGASLFAVDQFKSADAQGVLQDRPGNNLAL